MGKFNAFCCAACCPTGTEKETVQHINRERQREKSADMQVAAATVVVATLWGNMENLPQKKKEKSTEI